MRLILTILFILIYPLINANANEVKSCSVQPTLSTDEDSVQIRLLYTAAVINHSEKCVETGVINFNLENKSLNKSSKVQLYKCPGGASVFNTTETLVYKLKIKPENFDAELASVTEMYNQIYNDLSKSNASCEWYPD